MDSKAKVVSLSTAKLLLDDGWKVETEREYRNVDVMEGGDEWPLVLIDTQIGCDRYERIAAPDAQELGEALPFRQKNLGTVNDAMFTIHKLKYYQKGEWWIVGYVDEDTSKWPFDFFKMASGEEVRFENTNLAEAMASCWLFLRKQGLV